MIDTDTARSGPQKLGYAYVIMASAPALTHEIKALVELFRCGAACVASLAAYGRHFGHVGRLPSSADHRFVESSVKASDCWNRMASDVALAAPGSTVPSI